MTVLAGLALVALALGAPADLGNPHSSTGSTTAWENTQTQEYHCEGNDIVRCETTPGGVCFAMDLCEAYCFHHDSGASCVDLGAPAVETSNNVEITARKTSISVTGVNVAARDASSQEDMHYTCSRNRASVLICKYGFCSIDHYCRSGNECKDDCSCCKSAFPSVQGAKSEVRIVPKDAAISLAARGRNPKESALYVCSKDRASVLKCRHGFCATDYYCENTIRASTNLHAARKSVMLETEVDDC
ncbi:hypothetical protein ST47_g7920 [Ascochyta rabiei]|uniref:Uncharacterized protein n=1 Tax=Didymella rabiei TaxID=5454 RepID=A0A163A224_DIDRA|nr:hypothetical protein ST47_g7920 [Ascochyta rabiei]